MTSTFELKFTVTPEFKSRRPAPTHVKHMFATKFHEKGSQNETHEVFQIYVVINTREYFG